MTSTAVRCPRCTFTLASHSYADVPVRVCPRCRGVLLDPGEPARLLGPHTEVGAWQTLPDVRPLGDTRLLCPHGHGRLAGFRIAGDGVSVEVDACPTCRALWLDHGEALQLKRAAVAAGPRQGDDVAAVPGKRGIAWYLFQLFSGLPVEEYHPVHRIPWVVWSLILLCGVGFAVEVARPQQEIRALIELWGVVPVRLLQNPITLLTHMFLHGGVAHLVGNLWFLYVFGDNVEDRIGHWRFLLLYLASGVVGALLQTIPHLDSAIPAIGASGAIAGVMGAYLVLFPGAKVWVVIAFIRFRLSVLYYLGFWVLLQGWMAANELLQPLTGAGVAWMAHLAGFCTGALWALLNRSRFSDGAEDRRALPHP